MWGPGTYTPKGEPKMPEPAAPPQAPGMTEWFNPTTKDVKLDIYTGQHGAGAEGKQRPRNQSGRVRYIVPSLKSLKITSEYDQAIQKTRDGVVVAGMAPQLINQSVSPAPVVHPSLDPLEQARKEAAEKAQKALAEKSATEEALKLAEADRMRAADLKAKEEEAARVRVAEEKAADEAAEEARAETRAEAARSEGAGTEGAAEGGGGGDDEKLPPKPRGSRGKPR